MKRSKRPVLKLSGIHTLRELEADAATWADKNLFFWPSSA
jgi:hypothetical protein